MRLLVIESEKIIDCENVNFYFFLKLCQFT